jgi:hypothetical protein
MKTLVSLLALAHAARAQPGADLPPDPITTSSPLAAMPPATAQLADAAAHEARAGRCEAVLTIDHHVREVDPSHHEAFLGDPAVAACVASDHPVHVRLIADTARDRFTIGIGSVLKGKGALVDARLGWMVRPWLAVLGSVIAGTTFGDSSVDFQLAAVGARLWMEDHFFIDGRIGRSHARSDECDMTVGGCERYGYAWFAGVGVELLRNTNAAFEIVGTIAVAGDAGAIGIGMSVSLY